MLISNRRQFMRAGLFVLALALIAVWLLVRANAGETPESAAAPQSQTGPQSKQPAGFDKSRYPLDKPDSLWVIANKRHPLKPADYVPKLATPDVPLRLSGSSPEMQVSAQMAPALEQLFAAAKAGGHKLMVASGYRSYQTQTSVYNAEVRNFGQTTADRESARPGYSEHQTGLAVDVEPASRQCEVAACFGTMPEGKWVAANAYKYGFVIRYAKGSEPVTGYTYEPWHLRYVGKELAAELHKQGNPPLETFFDLGAAPDYQ